MKPHQYIQKWKQEGFKVRVRHERFFELKKQDRKRIKPTGKLFPCTKKEFTELLGEDLVSQRIKPRGGCTKVILEKDNKTLVAVADCSKEDGYCKKLGLSVAVGRILKQMEEK